jgi:uncharacterized RDD family membrane protein YckC
VSFVARRPGAPVAATDLPDVVSQAREIDDAPTGPYVGLVTRALAFAIDGALINGIAIVVSAVVILAFSVLSLPHELRPVAAAVGGVVYVLWTVGYFVTFWATTGQTPGDRVFQIRVRAARGGRIKPRRALLRFGGVTLAAIPFGAGFLLILFDDRRRGLQDRIARTVVVESPDEAPPVPRRGRSRAEPV